MRVSTQPMCYKRIQSSFGYRCARISPPIVPTDDSPTSTTQISTSVPTDAISRLPTAVASLMTSFLDLRSLATFGNVSHQLQIVSRLQSSCGPSVTIDLRLGIYLHRHTNKALIPSFPSLISSRTTSLTAWYPIIIDEIFINRLAMRFSHLQHLSLIITGYRGIDHFTIGDFSWMRSLPNLQSFSTRFVEHMDQFPDRPIWYRNVHHAYRRPEECGMFTDQNRAMVKSLALFASGDCLIHTLRLPCWTLLSAHLAAFTAAFPRLTTLELGGLVLKPEDTMPKLESLTFRPPNTWELPEAGPRFPLVRSLVIVQSKMSPTFVNQLNIWLVAHGHAITTLEFRMCALDSCQLMNLCGCTCSSATSLTCFCEAPPQRSMNQYRGLGLCSSLTALTIVDNDTLTGFSCLSLVPSLSSFRLLRPSGEVSQIHHMLKKNGKQILTMS